MLGRDAALERDDLFAHGIEDGQKLAESHRELVRESGRGEPRIPGQLAGDLERRAVAPRPERAGEVGRRSAHRTLAAHLPAALEELRGGLAEPVARRVNERVTDPCARRRIASGRGS